MSERRALVIARDRELKSDLDRVAAAAGCELQHVDDMPAGRSAWRTAPLVLLDRDAARECADAGLVRRHGVLVLSRGEPPPELWRQAFGAGAERVLVLPDAEQWLVDALADAAEQRRARGRVVGVIGGRGGAGASVFAAALALVALRRFGRALLVDCDPLGGGMDYLLGVEGVAGLRWPQLAVAGGRVPATALHSALPAVPAGGGRLTVLSCGHDGEPPPTPAAVAAVVESGRRAGDTVVCDLPRHLPEAALAALDRADLVVLVVPAEVRACAAAKPLAEQLRHRAAGLRLVVRGPAPGGLLPVDVARALRLPLLAAMRPAPGLAAALDSGRLPVRSLRGPLATTAAAVLGTLGDQGRRAA